MKKTLAVILVMLMALTLSMTGAYAKVGAALSSLAVEGGILTPAFDPGITEYTVTMPAGTIQANVTATAQEGWTISINGKTEKDGCASIPFKSAETTINIKAGDSVQTKEYKLTLKVASERKFGRYVDVPESAPGTMSALEKQFVETAFRLMPQRSPFVLAYQEAHGITIDSYIKTVNNKTVSGVPFSYDGTGHLDGYDGRWWTKTKDKHYPAFGMDCAEFAHWVYHNMGYEVPSDSAGLFFAGVTGVQRFTPEINKTHWVIPSLEEAKIGDIVYSSKNFTYTSGSGSHCGIFLGTARKLGIADTLAKYMPYFPMDAYLFIDTGWADGKAYYSMMRSIGIKGKGLAGVGIQYFPSIKGNDGNYIYESPYRNSKTRVLRWKDPVSGMTFEISAAMEREGRPFQHKPDGTVQYILNISRPIVRND